MLWLIYEFFKLIMLLIFPFILLIRGAVFLHERYGLAPWISTMGGVGFSAILLFIYFSFFYGKLTGSLGGFDAMKRRFTIAVLLMVLFSLQGILFFSSDNAKTSDIRNTISEVHPILRLSVSTLIYLDKGLLITDAQRQPEDYRNMGFQQKSHSLHYEQEDGYTHALDLRTKDRSEIRNSLTKLYFKLMGFNTLRHVGSADHLHISLLSHDRPTAI